MQNIENVSGNHGHSRAETVPPGAMGSPLKIDDAPGLKWRTRKGGWEARWRARHDLIVKGYPLKVMRLWTGKHPTEEEKQTIAKRCRELQKEMHDWTGAPPDRRPTHGSRSRIYFLSDGVGIKIGHSMSVEQRIHNIRSSNRAEITLLLMIDGTSKEETAIHKQFKHLRIRGEWFTPGPELIEFINRLREEAFSKA